MKKMIILFTLTLTAFAGTHQFDTSKSKVGFQITKYKVGSVVDGQFDKFSGSVDVNENKMTNVDIKIETSSINTYNEKRDNHLRSADFFNIEKPSNKFITFKSEGGANIADTFKIKGKLMMNGVSKDVTFNMTKVNSKIYEAKTVINKNDFGISWNRPMEKNAWEQLKSTVKGFAGKIIGDNVEIVSNIRLK